MLENIKKKIRAKKATLSGYNFNAVMEKTRK